MNVRRFPAIIVLVTIGTIVLATVRHYGENATRTVRPVASTSPTSKLSPTTTRFDLAKFSDLDNLEFEQTLVKNAPFSAILTIEQMQSLADGSTTTSTVLSLIYRDREGRTRRDRMAETQGSTETILGQPSITTVNDPIAGISYVLDPRTNLARRSVFMAQVEPSAHEELSGTGRLVPTNHRTLNSQVLPLFTTSEMGKQLQRSDAVVPSSSHVKRESLGQRQIEGITTEGTRIAMTIPAGAMKNEKPIEIVAERWYSPTLRTVILIEESDSRFGQSTYRLTDIKTGEQPPNLFIVPSDYKIRD